MIKNRQFYFLALIIPYLVIFQAFFSQSPLAWGDAPFFFRENFKELIQIPFLWNFRNDNFGAPQVFNLWLYLPNLIIGILGEIFKVPPQLVTRFVFYFPATILSIIGGWLFLKKFTLNSRAIFLGSFLYGFNTYNLTLLDGGQVGIALAYGLFPWALYFLISFFQNESLGNFFKALLILFGLINSDVRIFILAILLIFWWLIIEAIVKKKRLLLKSLARFLLLLMILLGLNSFWIIPSLNGGALTFGLDRGGSFVSILASFYLFQPHFPLNDFGKIAQTPFYFVLLPVLLTMGVLVKKSLSEDRAYLSWLALFFIFVFLAKGEANPFGNFYRLLIDSLPFGAAFRDSSKFFIPLLMSAAITLSISYQRIEQRLTSDTFKFLAMILIFGYLNLLIYPAFLNQLSGNLSSKQQLKPFEPIYQKIAFEKDFSRTLWFDERPQLGFSSWNHPAISANLLFKERPFASMIEGSYDLYNFLHSPQLIQWFDLLGIKFLYFPENERKKIYTEKEFEERALFKKFVSKIPSFYPQGLSLSFPAYQIVDSKPHIFAQEKAFLVLGGDDIFESPIKFKDFKIYNQGFIFLEEGKLSDYFLLNLAPSSVSLVLNSEKTNLPFVFLGDKLSRIDESIQNNWAKRSSADYLRWKSELLQKGIRTFEHDFSKGIAFSTQDKEKITFESNIKRGGDYYLVTRYMTSSDSGGIKVRLLNQEKDLLDVGDGKFNWDVWGPFNMKKGRYEVKFINNGGLVVLNTFALIEKKDLENAKIKADYLLNNFEILDLKSKTSIEHLSKNNWINVNYKMVNPTEYELTIPDNAKWLVFSDHYNSGWVLSTSYSTRAVPFYSMINGFYIDNNKGSAVLKFSPQGYVYKGIILSVVSLVVILPALLYYLFKYGSQRKN